MKGKKLLILILLLVAGGLVALTVVSLPANINPRSNVFDLIASAGIFGATITILFRIVFNDYFSGLSVNFEKYFKSDDWVMLRYQGAEIFGQIVGRKWRSIHIATKDGNMVVVPNKLFNESVFINLSRPVTNSRFSVEINLSPEIGPEKIINIIEEGLQSLEIEFPKLAPKVRLKEVSNMGVTYSIKYWLDPSEIGPAKMKHKVLSTVLGDLSKNDIYPISLSSLGDFNTKSFVSRNQELDIVS